MASNELDHQKHAPVMQSSEQVIVFDNDESIPIEQEEEIDTNELDQQLKETTEQEATVEENCAASEETTASLVKNRLQSWRQQAEEANTTMKTLWNTTKASSWRKSISLSAMSAKEALEEASPAASTEEQQQEEEPPEEQTAEVSESEDSEETAEKPKAWANVVDSVQTFRGRYAAQTAAVLTNPIPQILTQADRIQSSRVSDHWKELTSNLEVYEYLILLGRGMLGVNLKQCYKAGVYVDYLVTDGHSHRSGVVKVGDVIVRIGNVDCSKGTIDTIPQEIANSKRPVHICLATSGPPKNVDLNHVDVAVGVLHKLSEIIETTSTEETKEDVDVELVRPTSFDQDEAAVSEENQELVAVPDVTESNFLQRVLNPGAPPMDVQAAYRTAASKRNTEARVERVDDNLTAALRNALLLCVADGRRLDFLTRYLQKNDPEQHALLLLYYELFAFVDLYSIESKRTEVARRIAYKFFLPTLNGSELVLPILDFHGLVSDSVLRKLEGNLKNDCIPCDLFQDFQRNAIEALCPTFQDFLLSTECARMRAYMRNTAPYVTVEFTKMLQQKHFNYIMLYLVCQTDQEGFGEIDEMITGQRIEDAASGACAALFIRSRVIPELNGEVVQQLWEHFLAPGVGALHGRPEAKKLISALQEMDAPTDGNLLTIKPMLEQLSDELMYTYGRDQHPQFRLSKQHEWMCAEGGENLGKACIKRLLRKTKFPVGVTPHKPSHDVVTEEDEPAAIFNAECGVVFGTDLLNPESVCRYACQALPHATLYPLEVPDTLESYATVPFSRPTPFATKVKTTLDGWQVHLLSFLLPNEIEPLYGVSLTFVRQSSIPKDCLRTELVAKENKQTTVTVDGNHRQVRLSTVPPTFAQRLSENKWSDRVLYDEQSESGIVIGVALVSRQNVIPAMRETLSNFLYEFTTADSTCGLVDILGVFANHDIEADSLQCLLEPFLSQASTPWLERPLGSQKESFLQLAGEQLIRSLPPIPLSLMFLTALLEQKIVLSSSRRSVLFSAASVLSEMLRPLNWCHLLVPRVPANLASDLLQYPAPFILGIPTGDPGVMDLIRELPDDVTLVDLDVGRVILAPSFAHDNELGRGTINNEDTARALRSQVLYLAQCLGGVFGAHIEPQTWLCDQPTKFGAVRSGSQFDSLRSVCKEFVEELLSGATSCCYWVEEVGDDAEPTVVFDEDRFFRIKAARESKGFAKLFGKTAQTELAVSQSHFDLILALFLRCQSMNDYIGTRKRSEMVY